MSARIWLGLAGLLGCRPDGQGEGTDAAATDTATVGDTATAAIDASGTWSGRCAGDVALGDSGVVTTSYPVAYDLALALVDDAGALTGEATITVDYGGDPIVTTVAVAGSREGDALELRFEPEGTTTTAPVELRFVLVDDHTLTGDIVYFPDMTYGNPTFSLACTLTR